MRTRATEIRLTYSSSQLQINLHGQKRELIPLLLLPPAQLFFVLQHKLKATSEPCDLHFSKLNARGQSLFFRLFGIKCAKCNTGFCSSDLVMRARDNVYHMECFRCSVCSRHLLPGDEFSLRDDELLCRADHSLLVERAAAGSPLSPGNIHTRPLHISGIIIIITFC